MFLKSEPPSALDAYFSGIFCGLAFLFKYQSGILLSVFLIYILIVMPWLSHGRPGKAAFMQSLFLAAGFLSVLAALFGIFQLLGNWEDFYFGGWAYNFTFMADFTWPYFFKRFFAFTPRFILIWLMLWVFGFVAMARAKRAPREIPKSHHFVIIWLVGSALAVCIGGKFFGHYYIQLLPPLTILAAVSLAAWWQTSASMKYVTRLRVVVLAGIFIPPVIYLATNWWEEQKRMQGENRYFQNLAIEVRKLSKAGDKIFIWGRIPKLYYFSKRLPASRFITSNFVVGMNTYNYSERTARYDRAAWSRMWDWLLYDLATNRPKLIIDTSPQNFRQYGKYPISAEVSLRDFMHKNYHLVKSIDRVAIYVINF